MSAGQVDFPFLILRVAESLIYLFLVSLAIRRRGSSSASALFYYAGTAFLIQVLRTLVEFGWLGAAAGQRLDDYGTVLLALLLYQSLLAFFDKHQNRFWLSAALIWAALLVLLHNILLIFLTWLVLSALAINVLLQALRDTRQPLHRNRFIYWIPVLALALANDVFIFYRQDVEGDYLRLGASVLMAYVILRHHIPDMRDLTRQFLIYITTTLLTMTIYIAGFLLADFGFRNMPGYNPLFVGAGLAVVISLVFAPMFGAVRGLVNRFFKLESYDPSQTLREYSVSVSNILDLERLATVAVGLIMEALETKKVFIFLVDSLIDAPEKNVLQLTGIRGAGSNTISPSFALEEDSPVARFLREGSKPLLQYDIDFAPEFLDASLAERKGLSELGLDVYVPIHSKGDWIGLLALGPKPSGRYTDEDLNLLSAIASQTAIALENARLVENLKKLNVQVREAYAFLDKANHDLAQLEATKSNFISIASHELRTPLTAARGYTEMLLEDQSLQEPVRELVKGIHKSTLRLHEIMDSMFDIAQIDARTLELHRQEIFLPELIRSVVQEQAAVLAEREQEVNLDLPSLPSIKADPNTLQKLFYHLITNAIKFTPNGGKIGITARQVAANKRDLPEGGVEVIVSDTGVGIDQDLQEVIFTKFYQPGELLNRHSTGKTKFKGSGVGLGLALSRGIVEAHGGRIWAESSGYDERGLPGSQFHVVLPLRSQGESKTVRMGSALKLKL